MMTITIIMIKKTITTKSNGKYNEHNERERLRDNNIEEDRKREREIRIISTRNICKLFEYLPVLFKLLR